MGLTEFSHVLAGCHLSMVSIMTTPKRFEKMIQAMLLQHGPYRTKQAWVDDLAKILRRQHTAMMRQVKRMKRCDVPSSGDFDDGYERACDDFLAYLRGGK